MKRYKIPRKQNKTTINKEVEKKKKKVVVAKEEAEKSNKIELRISLFQETTEVNLLQAFSQPGRYLPG